MQASPVIYSLVLNFLFVAGSNSEKCAKEKITYLIKWFTPGYNYKEEIITSEIIYNNDTVNSGYYFNITAPVKNLCIGSLNISEKTAHFWLDGQGLEYIEPGTFENQNLYEQLRLSGNKLTIIKKGTFKNMAIKSLELYYNLIRTIEEGAFENLPNMDTLGLGNNQIQIFSPNSVMNTPRLRWFDISTNKLKKLDENNLKFLTKDVVVGIGLAGNELESLPAILTLLMCGQGITSGAHRLWAHRSYKAKLPLRILLCFFQTMAFQNHIFEWVRDHRVHHKFTDSDADPHNAKRGFFFSHIGWLMVKKHKDVFTKGKSVDMSDLEADGVVVFQRKYYVLLMPLACFVIPTLVPWYFWNENLYHAWYAVICRYTVTLNGTWLVNSAAHIWGKRPYDKTIKPTQNKFVAVLAFGEGWHNYHHVFPWDYKAAELGNYKYNVSTAFIDGMSRIGWAYDMKTASMDIIKKRIKRTGDGTIKDKEDVNDNIDNHGHSHEDSVWGWGDKDMKEEDKMDIRIYNKIED